MTHVKINNLTVGNDLPFTLIAGPCQIESESHTMEVASVLAEISKTLGIGIIYKSSYDKANRTSAKAQRGIGMDKGLEILARVREKFGMPVLTDVHDASHCAPAAAAVDVLQIPAFLCRQTDLLLAAGNTGRAINVKKGQFLAPWDMANVAAKIASTGNEKILLTERGVSFGYNTLVSDLRALPIMAQTGYPIVFDATHSVQQPGGQGHLLRRRTKIRPHPGPRGPRRRLRRSLHRMPPRPRQRALRRTKYDPACRNAGFNQKINGL